MGLDGRCCALEHLLTKPLTLPASSGSSCCFIDLTLLLISCPILEREWIAAQLQRLSDVERCVVIYCNRKLWKQMPWIFRLLVVYCTQVHVTLYGFLGVFWLCLRRSSSSAFFSSVTTMSASLSSSCLGIAHVQCKQSFGSHVRLNWPHIRKSSAGKIMIYAYHHENQQ